jgi:putative membrane protein
MLVQRRFHLAFVLLLGGRTAAIASLWAAAVFALYAYAKLEFLRVPFLPIASVGTAVAFYVGFKNNASYERFWEGRKIWGGIVNASRSWATNVISYVNPGDEGSLARENRQALIYRQLAWVNALRLQLRAKSRFIDTSHGGTRRRLEKHADHMRNDWDKEISPFLSPSEHESFKGMKNPATHMLTKQATHLSEMVSTKRLDLFHQIAMMETVTELYGLQGKCERIKNTPFPRMYAEYSRVFTRVFVALIPFGLLDVFADNVHSAITGAETWTPIIPMILSCALVTWVFTTMEAIGDATEDPFERSMSDVPMNALSRTIEIDLRQMLGETDLPDPEQAVGPILY